jgi:hypothetical protein
MLELNDLQIVPPLIWRTQEQSRALVALREQLKQLTPR